MPAAQSYKPGDQVIVKIGRGTITGTVDSYDEATKTVIIRKASGATVKRNISLISPACQTAA